MMVNGMILELLKVILTVQADTNMTKLIIIIKYLVKWTNDKSTYTHACIHAVTCMHIGVHVFISVYSLYNGFIWRHSWNILLLGQKFS